MQIKNDIKELGLKNVCLMSYQALEQKIKAKAVIPYYNYIVSDECHYFTSDAEMNEDTNISYRWVKDREKSTFSY